MFSRSFLCLAIFCCLPYLDGEEIMLYVAEGNFYIDAKEVTNSQYQEFVHAAGYRCPCYWIDGAPPVGYEEAPVVQVTYHDIQKYAQWRGVRIPTEEEWELASSSALKHHELTNFLDDSKKGSAAGGKLPDKGTNVAEWTSSSFDSSEKSFKTIRRGYVEKCCPGVPTVHRAPMFEEDCNISTGFRCVKDKD